MKETSFFNKLKSQEGGNTEAGREYQYPKITQVLLNMFFPLPHSFGGCGEEIIGKKQTASVFRRDKTVMLIFNA